MTRKVWIALAVLLVTPICALGWFGAQVLDSERQALVARTDELLALELAQVKVQLSQTLMPRQRHAHDLLVGLQVSAPLLRRRALDEPWIRHFAVLSPMRELLYPDLRRPHNDDEAQFIARTRHLWSRDDLFHKPIEGDQSAEASMGGWYTWFWESGLHMLYWLKMSDGSLRVAEMDRISLLADMLSALPQSVALDGFYGVLRDARGHAMGFWGDAPPNATSLGPQDDGQGGAGVRAAVAMSSPLQGWRLEAHLRASPSGTLADMTGLLALAGLLLGCVIAAYVFYRESTRQWRDAKQRVSFVNQVSHELKTPLTNIRMYAELLQRDSESLVDQDPELAQKLRKKLAVVVTETHRLSRLIGNVLNFARLTRGQSVAVRLQTVPLRATIEQILEQFAPALRAQDMIVTRAGALDLPIPHDPDMVGQILANLVSNAEKYGSSGKSLSIEVSVADGRANLVVSDQGPGIGAQQGKIIFAPFVRLNSEVHEGVSGTGIGLSLARELARKHGGDLVLLPTSEGAQFQCWWRIEGADA